MSATKTSHHLLAIAKRGICDFDPNATAATLVTLNPSAGEDCLAIKDLDRFLVGLMRSVGTGSVTSFGIYAATSAAGAGATLVVAHAIGSAPNAVGDTIWLECDVEQIREALATATHVGVKIALVTATDECAVFWESQGRFDYGSQTADYIS